MEQQQKRPGLILTALLVGFVVLLAAIIYADDVAAAVQRPFGARPGPDGTVEIVLDDFSFTPSVIRVKAGQRVRLVLRNQGMHTHEFMVGRRVSLEMGVTEPPTPDFFEGITDVKVEVLSGMAMPMGFGMDEMGGMEEGGMGMGEGEEMGGMEEGGMGEEMGGMEGMAVVLPGPGPHGEGMVMDEELHGSMVMMDPAAVAVIEFTVPADKVGTWIIGCFQEEGLHFDSGMRGILIVEQ